MLKISTICLILQEFLQRFISMGLKWETHGFDYLLHLSLQEAMIIYFLQTIFRILFKLSSFSIAKKCDICQKLERKLKNNHLATTICKQILDWLKFLSDNIIDQKMFVFVLKLYS